MKKESQSPINAVFVFFVIGAILFAAFSGQMKEVTDASFSAAKGAVTLALGLIGIMALWLGLVRILEAGGLMRSLARGLKPIMVRLFPGVPAEHPAMSAMILNVSANVLGLGNAATPFGIKAMTELDRLNPFKGTATNAMCLFLAMNTSSLTLLPLGVIGVRAAAGASRPADIFLPTIIATSASTLVAICAAFFLARRDRAYLKNCRKNSVVGGESVPTADSLASETENTAAEEDLFKRLRVEPTSVQQWIARSALLIFLGAVFYRGFQEFHTGNALPFFRDDFVSFWLMPFLMLLMIVFGMLRGVKIYEAVTDGAKQGFDIALRIIPYLVAILVAIAMFRASGAMELLAGWLSPITTLVGMPADVLPLALVRPLSGSGAFGVMSAIIEQDPNSYSAYVASAMMGSTETTFYVLAVYFGAAGVNKIRHALLAALAADVTGIVAACLACQMLWVPV